MIHFTSDTHYNHKNIVRGCSDWEDKTACRDFDLLEEHNRTIVNKLNYVVAPTDTLYHLGDWSFGGFEKIKEFRDQIECKDVHLILGNHDHHIEANKDNIQKLFTSVSHYKEITIGKRYIVLCHYALRVWNHSHKGSWMLYGHSHGTLDAYTPRTSNPTWIGDQYYTRNYRTMDVGVDTNDFLPYTYSTLETMFKGRDIILEVDHHGEKTT